MIVRNKKYFDFKIPISSPDPFKFIKVAENQESHYQAKFRLILSNTAVAKGIQHHKNICEDELQYWLLHT